MCALLVEQRTLSDHVSDRALLGTRPVMTTVGWLTLNLTGPKL
jgi:hypothetical protein